MRKEVHQAFKRFYKAGNENLGPKLEKKILKVVIIKRVDLDKANLVCIMKAPENREEQIKNETTSSMQLSYTPFLTQRSTIEMAPVLQDSAMLARAALCQDSASSPA